MSTTLVHVTVLPEFREDFIDATLANCAASRREPGNLRFDLIQSVENPNRFILFEAYADSASAGAHKETAHYAAWRDTVAAMMAEPRRGVPYRLVEE